MAGCEYVAVPFVFALSLLVAGCDCSWDVRGHVGEYGSLSPLPSVRIDRVLQVGVTSSMTNERGDFRVSTADRCDTDQTLIFVKEGFESVRLDLKGRQNGPLDVCMVRTVSP